MATEAQINANRENAKKSTGPRTPQGKAISSRNSLVHGMTSGQFLPPGADPVEFLQLLDQFRDRFQPFDEVEDALVERLVAAEIRMRTFRYLGAGLFHYQTSVNPVPEDRNQEGRMNPLAWAFEADSASHNTFTKLMRYEGALQREFSRALRELHMLQKERLAEAAAAAKSEAEAAETAPSHPEVPPADTKKETKRTQSPTATGAPNGAFTTDPPQNPAPGSAPSRSGGGPER